jgi:hypothetical protein
MRATKPHRSTGLRSSRQHAGTASTVSRTRFRHSDRLPRKRAGTHNLPGQAIRYTLQLSCEISTATSRTRNYRPRLAHLDIGGTKVLVTPPLPAWALSLDTMEPSRFLHAATDIWGRAPAPSCVRDGSERGFLWRNMLHDHNERVREYARRTADELLKNLHSRPTDEVVSIDCGVIETSLEEYHNEQP